MEKFFIDSSSNAVSEKEKEIEKRRKNYSNNLKQASMKENWKDHGFFKMLTGKGISPEDIMLEEAYSYNEERDLKKELFSSGKNDEDVNEIISDMDEKFGDIDLRIQDGNSKKIKIFRIKGSIREYDVELTYLETDPPQYKGKINGERISSDEAEKMIKEYKEFAEKKREIINMAKK